MKGLLAKAREGLKTLFPQEEKEALSVSIDKNSLDSEEFFKFQRMILTSREDKKLKDLHRISFKEELELNKLKEFINKKEKVLDVKEINLGEGIRPDYAELVEEEDREGEKEEEHEIEKEKNRKKESLRLQNGEIGEDVIEASLLPRLEKAKVNNLLILSDDAYTRQLVGYKKLIVALQSKNISFFEYTNIQPALNRESLKRIVDFALKNEINSVLVVGSDSLIDLSRLVIKKLVKPNSIRLQSGSGRPVVSAYYSFFALPTLVIPSTKLVEQKILDAKLIFKKLDYFDGSVYLFNPVNSADFVAYYSPFLLEYAKAKQLEVLHLLFFRLLFNYFDAELDAKRKIDIIRGLKSIEGYLNYLSNNSSLSLIDARIIMKMVAQCLDGRYLISRKGYGTWYRLAANLSRLTQVEFFKSLALFLPPFIEYIAREEREGREKTEELSYLLFGSVSSEGLILNLIQHLKKFKLPLKFFDIPSLKELDSHFVSSLVKRSSPFPISYRMVKTIVEHLAVG